MEQFSVPVRFAERLKTFTKAEMAYMLLVYEAAQRSIDGQSVFITAEVWGSSTGATDRVRFEAKMGLVNKRWLRTAGPDVVIIAKG